ncbi:MAG TPA: leucine-rich repeat domain-containing protein, partial [Negativicutes bacterium]|nr:leucine-rich repeat domain-containing protein [Negativicutes bacterium]
SGRVTERDIGQENKLSFANRDTEAMLRMILGKLSGAITQADLESISDLDMGVYFNSSVHDYIVSYDFQDLAMLTGLRSLSIRFGKSTGFTNLASIGKLAGLESLSISPYSDGLPDIGIFASLINLRTFDVTFSASEDNMGALAKLTKLEKVKWPGNELSALSTFAELKELTVTGTVRDYSVLSRLPKLTSIHIEGSASGNLGSLKSLKNLKSLYIYNLPLLDLSFLSKNTGLEKLQLNYCGVKNIKTLSNLGNLIELDLSNNEISDLAPLSGLKKLQTLKLNSNKILRIDSIRQLIRLRELDLGVNHIKDISALARFGELQTLDLSNNYISSTAPLKDLCSLEKLSLFRCGISDISVLAKLTKLESLDINSNSVTDISVLQGMTQMKQLDASLNKIDSINALKDMKGLEQLRICYNRITDIAALNGMIRLEELDLRFNGFSDTEPLLKATRLRELYLEGNPISDYGPVQYFRNATKAYITGLSKPGYVFGDAEKTDTAAYWNGNRIPCIKVGSRYAIALKDLNCYGYDAVWVDKKDGSMTGWQVARNDSKALQPVSVMKNKDEDNIIIGKAMYAVTPGLWDNRSITFVGVNSEVYVMTDQLEDYGFDVVYASSSDSLNISLWDK